MTLVFPPAALPFIGRADELAMLGTRLNEAIAGQSRAGLVAGEPGVGKAAAQSGHRSSLAPHSVTAFGGCRWAPSIPAGSA